MFFVVVKDCVFRDSLKDVTIFKFSSALSQCLSASLPLRLLRATVGEDNLLEIRDSIPNTTHKFHREVSFA